MTTLAFFLSFSLFTAQAQNEALFTPFKSSSPKVNLKNNKYTSALLIDENCSSCKKLIKKLNSKCKSFESKKFASFATGSEKTLRKKLKHVLKKDFNAYHNPDIEQLLEVGIASIPTYISKDKQMHVGQTAAYKAIVKDKVCIK